MFGKSQKSFDNMRFDIIKTWFLTFTEHFYFPWTTTSTYTLYSISYTEIVHIVFSHHFLLSAYYIHVVFCIICWMSVWLMYGAGAPGRTLSSGWWGSWIWMINKWKKINAFNVLCFVKHFEYLYIFTLQIFISLI